MGLKTYRAKRDADLTPEPVPGPEEESLEVDHTGDAQAGRGRTFVIQEHHATALHWDFRLERDGVLVSWAVPKGLPLDPRKNRLAKQTEDHPLSYATFGGTIPQGQYGGGQVTVWDHGSYDLEKWTDQEVKVVLHGQRVSGRYVLFRTHSPKGGRQDWMVHRMDGSPEGWTPLPEDLLPMEPVAGPLPAGPGWSFEVHWSGERVLIAVEGGRITGHPQLRDLGLQLGSRQVLLDGVLLPDGQLVIVDLLHLEGISTIGWSYEHRREALLELALQGPRWQVPEAFDDGAQLLAAATAQGLPGVMAKRRTSGYRPGEVTEDWVRVRAGAPRTGTTAR